MLLSQDHHVMEPHSRHCSPAAGGEIDRQELKLVPFVAEPAAVALWQSKTDGLMLPSNFLRNA
jgi:hypothetical protein